VWQYIVVYTVVGSVWAYLFRTNQRRGTMSETDQHREGQGHDSSAEHPVPDQGRSDWGLDG
jgi:hypothetical protein